MFNNLYLSKMKKSLYLKYASLLLIIVIVPLILVTIISYTTAFNERRNSANDINGLYLDEVTNTSKIVLTQVNNGYEQFATKKEIANFEGSYIGNTYEQQHVLGKPSDIPFLSNYLKLKQTVEDELNVLRSSNDFIHSVYFYDNKKGIVLTDRGIEQRFESFSDRDWDNVLTDNIPYLTIIPTEKINYAGDNQLDVIRLVYRSPNQRSNVLVINIDCKLFFKDVFSRLPNKSYNDLMIITENGQPVFYTNQNIFDKYKNIKFNSETEEKVQFLDKSAKTDALITHVYSKELKWLFLTSTNVNELYKNIKYISFWFWFEITCVIVLALWLTFIFSTHIYNPVLNVIEKLGVYKNSSSNSNELKIVEQAVNDIIIEKDMLEKSLDASKPAFRDKFIMSLLLFHDLDIKDIRQNLSFLDINLELSNLMLAVINLHYSQFENNISYSTIATHNILIERVMRIFTDNYKSVLAQNNSNEYILLLNCTEKEMTNITDKLKNIQLSINQTLDIACSIGISRHCLTAEELPRAYNETLNLLKYSTITPDGSVFFCNNNNTENKNTLQYPSYEMKMLSEYIMCKDREKALRIFSKITDYIKSKYENVSYNELRRIEIKILTELLDLLVATGSDLQNVLGGECDIYNEFADCKDINLIFEVFYALIDTALEAQNSDSEDASNNYYVQKIIKLIDKDCGENMTLASLAEKFNVTPTYISRLFKRHMDMTFMDYLTSVRMEKSKELLLGKKMRIKEISQILGYSNSDYFIKLFKQNFGVTPGEYKKLIK